MLILVKKLHNFKLCATYIFTSVIKKEKVLEKYLLPYNISGEVGDSNSQDYSDYVWSKGSG